MPTGTRIVSKKRSPPFNVGWKFVFPDPADTLDRRRTEAGPNGAPRRQKLKQLTIWLRDKRDAEAAFREHLDRRTLNHFGVADVSALDAPYAQLVNRFLDGAPLSEERRSDLRGQLERNLLNIEVGRDLGDVERLSTAANRLAQDRGECGDVFVRRRVVSALKQMTRWLASVRILPMDPLASWTGPRRTSEPDRKRALKPDEVLDIFAAADEMDELAGRAHGLRIAYETLLYCGNRPGAVLGADRRDFDGERILLPPGRGKKRNGTCHLPAGFCERLAEHLKARKALARAPLLLSPEGARLDPIKCQRTFVDAAVLAAVHRCWPADAPSDVMPSEVMFALRKGRLLKADGRPPTDACKIARRRKHTDAVQAMVDAIRDDVESFMRGVTLYSLRGTFISLARRTANHDAIAASVGHAPRDVAERHYLDPTLVTPRDACESVFAAVEGARVQHECETVDRTVSMPCSTRNTGRSRKSLG